MAARHVLHAQIRAGDPDNKEYLVEGMTGGVCLFDYNNDGWLDVYVVNGSTVPGQSQKTGPSRLQYYLFKNLRNGHFKDVTAKARGR